MITAEMKIVVHHDHTIRCEVNVELDAVSAELDGSREGGEGILGILARCAAVADTLDAAS
jgi:hypothetical protein